MLSPAQEIGGIESPPQVKIDCAKRSLEWRHEWKEGNAYIDVDHAKLLQDGILTLEEEGDGSDSTDNVAEHAPPVSSNQEDSESKLNGTTLDNNMISTTGQATTPGHNLDDSRVLDTSDHVESLTSTKKSTKKRNKSNREKKEEALAQVQRQQILCDGDEKNDDAVVHIILLKVTKFVTSPFNLAFFVALLFWRWYFSR
jgi:hypothetical protein